MSDMNFQLVLELITKGLDGFNKAVAAEKAAGDAAKSANNAAIEGARKAEAAVKAETKAIEQQSLAARAAAAAKKAAAAAAETAAKVAHAAEEKAVAAAHATANAYRATKAAAISAGAAIASAFHKSVTAAQNVARTVARAGGGVGRAFAKGIADGVSAELGPLLKNAWSKATGREFVSGPGAFKANATQGVASLIGTAWSSATANIKSATEAEERLRADYGVEGARRALAAADKAMVAVPFGRDDVRAALPDMMDAGIDPASERFRMIADAAAANGKTMADAAAAYKAARKGDFSGLSTLGLGLETDKDGNSSLAYRRNGEQVRAALDAGNAGDTQAKIDEALKARYADAAARKGASIDGMIVKASNSWDMFVGKVMNAGPLQFFREELKGVLDMFDEDAAKGDIDALATQIGTRIRDAMRDAKKWFMEAKGGVVDFLSSIQPAVDAVGGFGTALKVLAGLGIASWIASIIAPFATLALALTAVSLPALGIAAALIAIAAAAYLVYANWDRIGPALSAAWEGVKSAAVGAWDAIRSKASEAWEGVKSAAASAWTSVKDGVSGAWSWIVSTISGNLDAATGKIHEWGGAALEAMKGAFGKVKGWFDDAVGGLSKVWDRVTGAANGALSFVGLGKDATPDEKAAAERQRAIADAGRAQEAVRILNDLQALLPQVVQAVSSFDLAVPIQAAIEAARASIASVSFHAEGVALMNTLAAGIEAGAGKAVAAVRNVAQQMRDHLPHSPAKVGPLSDLDRIRFSETIAEAIRPGPAVEAARLVAAGMRDAVAGGPTIGVLKAAGADGAAASPGGGQAAGSATINLTFAPTINAAGGDRQSILDQLRPFAHELAELVRRELARDGRLKFRDT